MRAQASAKAEIKIVKINRDSVEIEVRMPDRSEVTLRTLKEGETYINTVRLDIELPSPELSTFEVRS